jgi:hypothetical protein
MLPNFDLGVWFPVSTNFVPISSSSPILEPIPPLPPFIILPQSKEGQKQRRNEKLIGKLKKKMLLVT